MDVGLVGAEPAVLVLDLEHDDGAGVCVEEFGDDGDQGLEVGLDLVEEGFVVGAQYDVRDGQQPRRQPTKVPFRAHIGPGSEQHHELILLR